MSAASRLGASIAAALRRIPQWTIDLLLVVAALADALLTLTNVAPITVVLAAIASLGLFVRRRWPLVSMLLVLPALHVGCAVIAMVVALFSVASRVRSTSLIAVCAAVVLATQLVVADPLPGFRSIFSAGVSAALFAGGPVALGLLARAGAELRRRYEELQRAQEEQRKMAAREALARERAILAREMHDVVSHNVSLIAVQAGALQVRTSDDAARDSARAIRGLSVVTLEELRTMVTLLRAVGGTAREMHPQPTIADIPGLIAASGVVVEEELDFPEGLPLGVQRAVYRTVQECLTNARKHSPGGRVRLAGGIADASLRLDVATSPATETPQRLPGSGLGLIGLAERAQLLGGSFRAGATAGGGWQARLVAPIR